MAKAKIAMREKDIVAVETRTGLFVVAQALKHKTLVFLNLFILIPLQNMVCRGKLRATERFDREQAMILNENQYHNRTTFFSC